MAALDAPRTGSSPSASTLHPTSSDGGSQSGSSPAEKVGNSKNKQFDEKRQPSVSGSEDSGYEDRGEHEVDDEGKKKRVKVVLEKRTGKELVKEIGTGPYTIPRW